MKHYLFELLVKDYSNSQITRTFYFSAMGSTYRLFKAVTFEKIMIKRILDMFVYVTEK